MNVFGLIKIAGSWIGDRKKEPSTIMALIGLATVLGLNISPDEANTIEQAATLFKSSPILQIGIVALFVYGLFRRENAKQK